MGWGGGCGTGEQSVFSGLFRSVLNRCAPRGQGWRKSGWPQGERHTQWWESTGIKRGKNNGQGNSVHCHAYPFLGEQQLGGGSAAALELQPGEEGTTHSGPFFPPRDRLT